MFLAGDRTTDTPLVGCSVTDKATVTCTNVVVLSPFLGILVPDPSGPGPLCPGQGPQNL